MISYRSGGQSIVMFHFVGRWGWVVSDSSLLGSASSLRQCRELTPLWCAEVCRICVLLALHVTFQTERRDLRMKDKRERMSEQCLCGIFFPSCSGNMFWHMASNFLIHAIILACFCFLFVCFYSLFTGLSQQN